MGGGVDDELYVMGPAKSSIRHFEFLSIVVVIWNGSVEHTEPTWCSEVMSYHPDVYFHLTRLSVRSRRGQVLIGMSETSLGLGEALGEDKGLDKRSASGSSEGAFSMHSERGVVDIVVVQMIRVC